MADSNKNKPKVLFVGIDAADPDYLDKRFSEGALPNLASFKEKGCWGRMRSTFPVLSSAAWSTISTGLPPEKHGIYEFTRRKAGTWQDEIILGGLKQGEDVWQIAARNGLRTVSINMPMTYPPQGIPDGVVVSGMDTPGEGVDFITPKEEKKPFLAKIPGYRIEQTAAQFDTIDQFIEATSTQMENRQKAALYLFKRFRPDLAIVIFTALDRILHALWKYVDPDHPAFKRPEAESWRKQIDKLYDQVDTYLGELIEWAGENSTTIICSDHGGAAVHGIFYLNRWLIREGYLSVSGGGNSGVLRVISGMQKWVKLHVPRGIKNVFNRIFPNLYENVETKRGLSRIIPAKTKLYAWRKTDVIRVNLAGREPGGIVEPGDQFNSLLDEVKSKLENVVDPRTGHTPIKKVWTRFEVYPDADDLEDCPDLVIEWNDKLYAVDTTFDNPGGTLFESEEKPGKPWREEINGNHAPYGIFGAKGRGVLEGKMLGDVDIKSVTPAILHALNIAKPSSLPANPPGGVFDNLGGGEMKAETDQSEQSPGTQAADEVYTDEEREIIEKRLRDLGYM